MFNPFAPFDRRLLSAFKQKGVKAIVTQTYDRGASFFDEMPQPAFLLTHFTDSGMALEHFNAIRNDPNRQIFNPNDPESWRQLVSMLNKPAGRLFYTSLTIKDVNQKAKQMLDRKIRDYISSSTNWRPGRHEQVNFSLDFIFGEIYVRLSYRTKEVKIRLSELENHQEYVL